MDKDEGIRTLWRWFGNKCFRMEEITDEKIREIAMLVGADTSTLHGTRSLLGKRLTAMHDYECKTTPNKGAKLKHIPTPEDTRPGLYQIQNR